MIADYLLALGLTLAIEIAVAKVFFSEKYIIKAVILMNLVSHPVFNLALYFLSAYLGWRIGWLVLIYFEIGIVILEALLLLYAGFGRKKSVALSLCANTASFSIGFILTVMNILHPYL